MFGRDILQDDGRAAISACVKVVIKGKPESKYYTGHEAITRVFSCFTLPVPVNVPALPMKSAYDIADIKLLVEKWDDQKINTYPETNKCSDSEIDRRIFKQRCDDIDNSRQQVQAEYEESIRESEIEYGTGFIIADGLILTNRHVIEAAIDNDNKVIISNAKINNLTCKILYVDPANDLALLYSPELHLQEMEISPLIISNIEPPPGVNIFSFGYPMSHIGETALFTHGYVSGIKEQFAKPHLLVLNCSLNSGNSGGPVMCRIEKSLNVVGIATQKHFKKILAPEEMEVIEDIRDSMKTLSISKNQVVVYFMREKKRNRF